MVGLKRRPIKLRITRRSPSLWMNATFDAIKFTWTRLPFPKDFPSNYQSLHSKSPLELFKLAKTYLLRRFLIKWVHQEKHIQFVDDLKSKLAITHGIITQQKETVKTLMKEKEDLKTLLRMVAAEARMHATATT